MSPEQLNKSRKSPRCDLLLTPYISTSTDPGLSVMVGISPCYRILGQKAY